jgi:hypothetical protein
MNSQRFNGEVEVVDFEDRELQDALDSLKESDLQLPDHAMLELMSGHLADLLNAYHVNNTSRKAAGQVGENAKAESLAKELAFLRTQIAIIMYRHPGAKAIADDALNIKARRTSANRAASNQ